MAVTHQKTEQMMLGRDRREQPPRAITQQDRVKIGQVKGLVARNFTGPVSDDEIIRVLSSVTPPFDVAAAATRILEGRSLDCSELILEAKARRSQQQSGTKVCTFLTVF
jgi:hypothetical protein